MINALEEISSLKLKENQLIADSYKVIKNIANNIPVPHVLLVMDAVKGSGEVLPLAGNHKVAQPSYTKLLSHTPTTRIGILSGMESYTQNAVYTEGSPLSLALSNYLRQEQSDELGWTELSKQLEKLRPNPIYVEFGDHMPGTEFTLRPKE